MAVNLKNFIFFCNAQMASETSQESSYIFYVKLILCVLFNFLMKKISYWVEIYLQMQYFKLGHYRKLVTIKNYNISKPIQMLRRTIKFFCSETPSHIRELLRKCQTLEQEIEVANQKIVGLRQQVGAEQKKLDTRNKQIHELRSQLTKDVLKGQQMWKNARNKSQLHKKQSIQNFAKTLTSMVKPINEIKDLQKQEHDADLKEGFHLTSRLFFNTLEKYNIKQFNPALKSKYNKDEMIVQKEVKSENQKDKGTVAKVTDSGFTAEGKIIHKAKVHVFI